MTMTTQADIFKDIQEGIIQPGIFYNLVCRATKHTLLKSNKNTNPISEQLTGLLDRQFIENSEHQVAVHNEAPEIKTRISEAILQRKNQARQAFNPNSIADNQRVNVNDLTRSTYSYISIMEEGKSDTYTKLYELERKLKDIKLKAFNLLIKFIEGNNNDIKNPNITPEKKKRAIELKSGNNKVLANFYSKAALLNENKQVADMLTKVTPISPPPQDKEGIQRQKEIYIERAFLQGKIDFNNKFIKENIQKIWFQQLRPTKFISTPEKENLILTNTYKKYRNETAKKYKKTNNGKWVENVSSGGRRRTRKRKYL